MFKKTLIVLAVAAFSFALAGLAVAEDAVAENVEKGPLSLSVRGNVINSDIFTDSDIDGEFSYRGEADRTGFGFGIAAEYDLPWYDLSLEAAVDRFNLLDEEIIERYMDCYIYGWNWYHHRKEDGWAYAYAYGQTATFDSTDLSLSLKYNFKQLEDYKIVPYVLGGVGYMFNDCSLFNVDNSFETHVGAGLNYLINDSWSLYAEGRYLWSEANVSDSFAQELNGEDRYKIDLDSFVAMAGLKYRF